MKRDHLNLTRLGLNPLYQCRKCDSRFDEPSYVEHREVIDYGIGSRWVTLFEGWVCPECESQKYELINENEDDDDTAEPNQDVGVGLQHKPTTEDDGKGVA